MFIFIETTFDVSTTNKTEFLHTDKLLFDVDDNLQEVNLVTLVKDAVFFVSDQKFRRHFGNHFFGIGFRRK